MSHAVAFRRPCAVLVVTVCFAVASPSATRAQQPITRVSVDSAGHESHQPYRYLARVVLSADARFIAFDSSAPDLVADDHNLLPDVFVHDRDLGTTVRVDLGPGGVEADGFGRVQDISNDGRFVAFESDATNLVAGDTNGCSDVFVHDRDPDGNGIYDEGNGVTIRVSVRANGNEGNGASHGGSISGDGRLVVFDSVAKNLVKNDRNDLSDVFLHDVVTGGTTRLSVASGGGDPDGASDLPRISRDGRFVAFSSVADDLVNGDANLQGDIFRVEVATGATLLASIDGSGVQGDFQSRLPAISADGNAVAFESLSTNLVAGDTNFAIDVFVHRFDTGTTERASVASDGSQGGSYSGNAALSGDGRLVAFYETSPGLDPADTNGIFGDVYLHDTTSGATTCESVTCFDRTDDAESSFPSLSDDGRYLAFASESDQFVADDRNGGNDAFLRDRSVPFPRAASIGYGTGFPGTFGVPTLTASAPPAFGTNLTLDLSNSSGAWSVAFLALGLERASSPTSAGGTLLVTPIASLLLVVPPFGASLPCQVPMDVAYCGLVVDLQALELDAGAIYGISFTPGLELLIGD